MSDSKAPSGIPGVGARRKPRNLPTLPISAFTPPNSSTSESFPIAHSPAFTHPTAVIDANLSSQTDLDQWRASIGRISPRNVHGVAISLPAGASSDTLDAIKQKYPLMKILSVLLPVDLEQGPLAEVPKFGETHVTLSIAFTRSSESLIAGLRWALENACVVDINIQSSIEGPEGLEELLTAVYKSGDSVFVPPPGGAIILSNFLPPPHDLNISLVKLLTHSTYLTYQNNVATLSLFPSVYIKYLPPQWNATSETSEDGKNQSECKKKVKMFLGPVVEAFGFGRIMFGSSKPNPTGVYDTPTDWYECARESLTELGVDQESLDAVFETSAKSLYNA